MKYDIVIGLEVHVQARTRSKMFCACANESLAEPNTHVCPVCLGYPGVLPVPNEEAIRKTIVAGLMIDCAIAEYSKFDRKSYFYPDMPKNYQISQFDLPLCNRGRIRISGKGFSGKPLPDKEISVTRIHLEEDTAKSTHFGSKSGIDFNRAGTPLLEIVSEPDMSSPDEAYAYLVALKQAMQYADISNCDMEKGQLRCDVNVSLKPAGAKELGVKVELKNLNSFKAVHRALEHEIERQRDILEDGDPIYQDTRGWNDEVNDSYLLRRKENADDYRYFPDPDLMPIVTTPERLAEITATVPESPAKRRARFVEGYGLPEYDAGVLTQERSSADFFEACVKAGAAPKKASNWVMTEVLRGLSDAGKTLEECAIKPEHLAELLKLIDDAILNNRIAKEEVFPDMFEKGMAPGEIVKAKGLIQVTDASAISEFVQQAIDTNPGPVAEFKEGKENALNFLVGQVMRFSKGKANPQLARTALQEALKES